MAHSSPPTLRLHKSGLYFVHYAGRTHYLGRDKPAAQTSYIEHLSIWSAMQQEKASRRQAASTSPKPSRGPSTKPRLLVELATELLAIVELESGPNARRYLASHLQRLLVVCGAFPANQLHPPHFSPIGIINGLKVQMLAKGYAPKTINHDIGAAKRLFDWSGAMGYISAYSLKAIKPVRLGEKKRVDVPVPTLIAQIKRAEAFDPRLGPWLRLHYLTAARPSELVRLVHGQGKWEQGGPMVIEQTQHSALYRFHSSKCLHGSVFQMQNKVSRITRDARYLPVSPEALAQLCLAGPHWRTAGGYAQAVVATGADHRVFHLRHTAASGLRSAGAGLEEIETCLGHWPPGAWRSYVREAWSTPLKTARCLTLAPLERAWESNPANAAQLRQWQQEAQQQHAELLSRSQRGRPRRVPANSRRRPKSE